MTSTQEEMENSRRITDDRSLQAEYMNRSTNEAESTNEADTPQAKKSKGRAQRSLMQMTQQMSCAKDKKGSYPPTTLT